MFKKYLSTYRNVILSSELSDIEKLYIKLKLFNKNNKNNTLWIFGNGGSQAISSHISTDITKNTNIKSMTASDADLITCFSNDYGYENYLYLFLKKFSQKNDMVILISSSGKSMNILNAAQFCKKNSLYLCTFSGFEKKNKLRKYGNTNIWINSKKYNFVEVAHLQILACVVDRLSDK
jgi:D-sedoheptulose 7-phosphate isomerase